ncbi:unnamed protein product, partial [Polarella glacialis]
VDYSVFVSLEEATSVVSAVAASSANTNLLEADLAVELVAAGVSSAEVAASLAVILTPTSVQPSSNGSVCLQPQLPAGALQGASWNCDSVDITGVVTCYVHCQGVDSVESAAMLRCKMSSGSWEALAVCAAAQPMQ